MRKIHGTHLSGVPHPLGTSLVTQDKRTVGLAVRRGDGQFLVVWYDPTDRPATPWFSRANGMSYAETPEQLLDGKLAERYISLLLAARRCPL